MFSTDAHAAAAVIQQKIANFTPKLGLILGSGLGGLAEKIDSPVVISYRDLPGFFQCSVEGHSGNLYLGNLAGYPVACLQGRAHLYEGVALNVITTLIRTLKLIGCEQLIITNSAGSLRSDFPTGSLMCITDHINFQFANVLVGPNDDHFGPRFFSMDEAYDLSMREHLKKIAQAQHIALNEGVYIAVLGPSFETPAEIRAFRTLGADAVGMSTVQEVIAANHCGLKTLAISAITNLAAGLSKEKLSHEQTLRNAQVCMTQLSKLLLAYIGSLSKFI